MVFASASGDPPYLALFWLSVAALLWWSNRRSDRQRRRARAVDPVPGRERFLDRIAFESASDRFTRSSMPRADTQALRHDRAVVAQDTAEGSGKSRMTAAPRSSRPQEGPSHS